MEGKREVWTEENGSRRDVFRIEGVRYSEKAGKTGKVDKAGKTGHVGYAWVLLLILVCLLLPAGCLQNRRYSGVVIGNSKDLSRVIRSAMVRRTYRIRVRFKTHSPVRDQVEDLVSRMMEDALNESEDPCTGDYLRYQYGGYTLKYKETRDFSGFLYTAGIEPVYYTSTQEEAAVDERIAEVIENLGLNPSASDYEKVRCVRDFICRTVDYDTVHRRSPGSSHIPSTAYAALFYHTALCQGYAVLCYRLLKELGLDTRIVTGQALVGGQREKHAWNIVRVDGAYYNLDVTMDDVKGTRDYFLKCDKSLAATHQKDENYQSEEFCREYPMALEDY